MKALVVTAAARADLDEIRRHTVQRWGEEQWRRYGSAIQKRLSSLRLSSLRRRSGMGAPRPEIAQGYRSILVGRHLVFYREAETSIVIMRILHASMDHVRHIDEE